jgi:hypothetical protein
VKPAAFKLWVNWIQLVQPHLELSALRSEAKVQAVAGVILHDEEAAGSRVFTHSRVSDWLHGPRYAPVPAVNN